MTDRNELARDIFVADNSRLTEQAAHAEWAEWVKGGVDPKQNYTFDIADGLIAKGYSKPRVVVSADELDALPAESVVISAFGVVRAKHVNWESGDDFWMAIGSEDREGSGKITLPATVLYGGAL